MCGISGIIGPHWDRKQLEAMVEIQHHRGPDDAGIYVNKLQSVGLGHNRLSIIDLSHSGHQPMSSYNQTLWIVFNGEIYNYKELRKELSEYPYKSQTDTEVILAAYQKWGEKCVDHFIGMFAFALWDSQKNQMFCARDRLGIKPFYYTHSNDCFLFSSEIKALLVAGCKAEPNLATWSTYLNHGYYDHGSETFFSRIHSLSPGHILIYKNNGIKIKCYWDVSQLIEKPLSLEDDEAAKHLKWLLQDSIKLRLRSDVPLGVNLSGGLDSASLMVIVDELMKDKGEIQTFTASYNDPLYDEYKFASEVTKKTQWKENIQRLSENKAQELIEDVMWHQEAPFGGIATLAYHALHGLAKENGITVLLEGQGVDEMLAGYDYFLPQYYLDLLEQNKQEELYREIEANGNISITHLKRLQATSTPLTYQDGTLFLHSNCIAPEIRNLSKNAPIFPQPFSDRLSNSLYRDLRYTKLPRVLRMNDKLSMAFSRELREPFLDHRIVEFLFRLPSHQKIRLGLNKFILRHAMSDRLPNSIRLVKKRSVVTPQREWMRTSFKNYVEEIIRSSSFKQRGYFDVKEVQEGYQRFLLGEGDNAFFIWQWINTEIWFRKFIDKTIH